MTTYTPRLDDFILQLKDSTGINSSNEYKKIVKDIPFSNRNLIQSTGKSTQTFTCTAVFMNPVPLGIFGIGISPSFDNHILFQDFLDNVDLMTFIHPDLGVMDVHVSISSTFQDSTIEYIEYNLTIVRQITDILPLNFILIIPTMQKEFFDMSLDWQDKIDIIFDAIGGVIADVQAFQAKAEQFKTKMNSFFTEVQSLPNSIINSVEYANNVAGELVFSVNQTVDRLVEAAKVSISSPTQFINNMLVNARELRNEFISAGGEIGLEATLIAALAPARIAIEMAQSYVADDENRESFLQNVNVQTFDPAGNFIGKAENVTVMTINELEQTVESFRDFVNQTIQIDRSNRPLQVQAKELQTYVDSNKLNKDKIIKISTNKAPLGALLLQRGISYQRLDEEHKLNPNIRKPNFYFGSGISLVVPV